MDNLSVRINAHKRFSNFSLEEWLDKNLPFNEGNSILDIGCGNGNLFPVYSKKLMSRGVIVGIDQSPELLSQAANTEASTPKILMICNMNHKLPFIESIFDYVISTFAIYYTDDVDHILNDIKRVLKGTGQFIFIGPSGDNARELYEFNKAVFGLEKDERISARTNRLEKEFYPAAKNLFRNVFSEKIKSKLVFPDKEEFLRYYLATLLYEESVKKTKFLPDKKKCLLTEMESLEISKEMFVLWGIK